VEAIKTKTTVVAVVQSCRTAPYTLANVRFRAWANCALLTTSGAKWPNFRTGIT